MKPIEILLVEDNPGDALLIREMLREAGAGMYNLTHAERLAEGLAKLRSNGTDVLLLDLSLPDSQGLETVSRAQAHAGRIPIIVLTGLEDEDTGLEAVKIGAQDFLTKGQIDGRLLIRATRYAIERKRTQEELQRQQEWLSALHEIEKAISSTLDLDMVLGLLLDRIDQLLPYAAVSASLWCDERKMLAPAACRKLDEKKWLHEFRETGCPLAQLVLRQKSPVAMGNLQSDSRLPNGGFYRAAGIVSYLGTPLIVNGEIIGVLGFYTAQETLFGDEETTFLSTLAGQAAAALYNARLYQNTRLYAEELAQANRVKDDFLSVVSHELRTPVHVIVGYTKMVKERLLGEVSDEQERALTKVENGAESLLALINNILQVTAIENKTVSVVSSEWRLDRLVDDLRSSYPGNFAKQLALQWEFPHDLPAMQSDYEKLAVILRQLIDNAIKFTAQGEITVSGRYLEEADEVVFQVADSGIGIPKELLPTIFGKFLQSDSTNTRSYEGVGLGLYIVKKLTELLNGKVGVESAPGSGSTFTVTLPRRYGMNGAVSPRDTALPSNRRSLDAAPPSDGYRHGKP